MFELDAHGSIKKNDEEEGEPSEQRNVRLCSVKIPSPNLERPPVSFCNNRRCFCDY